MRSSVVCTPYNYLLHNGALFGRAGCKYSTVCGLDMGSHTAKLRSEIHDNRNVLGGFHGHMSITSPHTA